MWDPRLRLPSECLHPEELPCNLGVSGAPKLKQTDAYRQVPTSGASPQIVPPQSTEARLNSPINLEDSLAFPCVSNNVVWDHRRARCNSRYCRLPSLAPPAL